MPVFNTYFKIAKKQLPSMIMYIAIFSVILSLFASIGNESTTNYKSTSCNIAVFDSSNSKESECLKKYLEGIHEFVDIEDDKEVITDNLFYQKVDYVLYIDENFESNYKLSNLKRPGTFSGSYVDTQIDNYLKSMKSLLAAGYSTDEAYDITMEALNEEGVISLKGKATSHDEIYFFFLFVPYVLLMTLFSILVPVSTAFNRKEVSDRMKVSKLKGKNISMQLLLGTIVLSAIIYIVVLGLSVVRYKDEPFKGDNIYYILNSVIFTLVGVGVTTLVSNFNPSQNAVNMVANIVTLGMCFLGGVFVPLEVLGEGVLKIAKFMPTYWYMTAHHEIESNGITDDALYAMGIQILFAVTFIVVSFLVAKRKKINREG